MTKTQLMNIRKTDDFLDALQPYGYYKVRQESSHMIFSNGNITLSIPKTRELSDGTKRNIVKQVLGDSYYNKG